MSRSSLRTFPQCIRRKVAAFALLTGAAACRSAARDPAYAYSLRTRLPVAHLTTRDVAAIIAAVDSSGATARDRAPICLAVRGADSTLFDATAELQRTLAPGRRVVRRIDCPPTYTTMVRVPDRAPRGYVDPHIVTISIPRFESSERGVVVLSAAQGTAETTYECLTWRAGGIWRAHCQVIRTLIS